jgi:hypothetical protein
MIDKFRRKLNKTNPYPFKPKIITQEKPILVYTAAIGAHYHQLANMLKLSCLKQGYKLTILDEKYGSDPVRLRIDVNNLIDINAYEWIVYIDADCLVFGDIRKLLTHDIVVQKDGLSFNGNINKMRSWPKDYGIKTEINGDFPGACCGVFALSSKIYSLLDDWLRLYDKTGGNSKVHHADQVILNIMLYNNHINFILTDKISYLKHDNTIIAHYYNGAHDIMRSDFNKYF